jgi:hypothetical protein
VTYPRNLLANVLRTSSWPAACRTAADIPSRRHEDSDVRRTLHTDDDLLTDKSREHLDVVYDVDTRVHVEVTWVYWRMITAYRDRTVRPGERRLRNYQHRQPAAPAAMT